HEHGEQQEAFRHAQADKGRDAGGSVDGQAHDHHLEHGEDQQGDEGSYQGSCPLTRVRARGVRSALALRRGGRPDVSRSFIRAGAVAHLSRSLIPRLTKSATDTGTKRSGSTPDPRSARTRPRPPARACAGGSPATTT